MRQAGRETRLTMPRTAVSARYQIRSASERPMPVSVLPLLVVAPVPSVSTVDSFDAISGYPLLSNDALRERRAVKAPYTSLKKRTINSSSVDCWRRKNPASPIGCCCSFHFHPLSPTRCDSRGTETGVVSGEIGMERLGVSHSPRMRASEARRRPCGHASCSNDARRLDGCLPQKRWSLETL